MTNVASAAAEPPSPPAGPPRPFRIEVHRTQAAVTVVPVGELDLATSAELEAELRAARTAASGELRLDLRELDFIDSSGIHVILAADRDAEREGCAFAVIPGRPAVQRVLEVSGVSGRLRFRTP
jgi:anti-anti-sigma factor